MNKNDSNSPSWGRVLFALIIFWPAGLYLMSKKSGKGIKRAGWIFVILGIIYTWLFMSGDTNIREEVSLVQGMGVILVVLYGSGFLMIHIGRKKMRKLEVTNFDTVNLEQIHKSMGGYEIPGQNSWTQQTIIHSTSENVTSNNVEPKVEKAEPKIRIIACKNCGANNRVISDQVTECEFCGSLISG